MLAARFLTRLARKRRGERLRLGSPSHAGPQSPPHPASCRAQLCRPGLRRCWVSRVRGASWPLTEHPHKAVAQEIEVGAAKHLALEHLEAVDMPLHGAIAPGHGYSRFDSGL
jgi:hypothetical protein